MKLRLSEPDVRLFGWFFILTAKVGIVVFFHVWSMNVGREGLSPVVVGGDDGEFYLPLALRIANGGWAPPQITLVWPIWVGHLMHETGWRGAWVFKAILLAASLATAWFGLQLFRALAADLLRRRPSAREEVALGAALVLFPSTLWVASYSIYRDAVIYCFAMVSVYAIYQVMVRRRPAYLALFAPSLYILFQFRWYAAVAVLAGSAGWLAFTGGSRRRALWRVAGVAAVLGAALVAIELGYLGRLQESAEVRDYFQQTNAQSNIGISYTESSVWMWPALFLYSFVSNLIGPLPNQISSASTLIGFVFEVPLLAYVLWRVAHSPASRRPEVLLLLFVAATWFALIAIYNDNVGTALRLRVVGYQFLFIAALLDHMLARVRRSRARRRVLSRPPEALSPT